MEKNNDNYIQNLLLIFHVCLAIFIIVFTTCLVFKFYEYQPKFPHEVRPYAFQTAVNGDSKTIVKREAQERLAYALSVFSMAIVVFLSFFLSQKYLLSWLKNRSEKRLRPISEAIVIIAGFYTALCLLILISASNFLLISAQTLESYLQKQELYSSFYPIISAFIISYFILRCSALGNEKFKKITTIILSIIAVILSLFIVSYALFDEYSLEGYAINFNPIAYPMVQVFLGKALLIDFKSLYGLHPYFLAPFLHLFPLSVLGISSLLALLLLIVMLSIGFCFFSIIKNRLLAFVGFVAFLYVQNFGNLWWPIPGAVIFQYEPIRLFFPSLLLSFFVIFFKNPTALKYYAGLIFFACGTMWNLDTGIPTFLTLIIILGYEKWFVSGRVKLGVKSLTFHAVQTFGILASLWICFWLLLRIKYGQWPIMPWLTYGQNAAFEFGYAMLPMDLLEIWYIPVLIYVIGYVMMVHNFFAKKYSLQDNFIAVLTLLGIGLFTYFIGRSHLANLFHCGYPAVILVTIFADKFCATFSKEDLNRIWPRFEKEAILFILPLLFVSYFFVLFWFNLSTYLPAREHFITTRFFNKLPETRPYWMKEVEFIKKHIGETDAARDDLLILNLVDQDYYFALELKAIFPLSFVNLRHTFYMEEMNQLHDLIKSRKKKWVILVEPQSKDIAPSLSVSELRDIKLLLSKNYKISAHSKIDSNDKVVIYSAL